MVEIENIRYPLNKVTIAAPLIPKDPKKHLNINKTVLCSQLRKNLGQKRFL